MIRDVTMRFASPVYRVYTHIAILLACLSALAGCGHRAARAAHPRPPARGNTTQAAASTAQKIFSETGLASWYGDPYHGRRSASGEIFDKGKMTAAHRTLPFETWVRVEDLENGKSVEVRINDRGPFVDGRIIDLSQAAAREMGLLAAGLARVRVEVIDPPDPEIIAASHSAAPLLAKSVSSLPPVPRPSPPLVQPASAYEKANDSRSSPDGNALPNPLPAAVPPPFAKPSSANTIEQPAAEWFAVQVGIFANREQGEQIAADMAKLFGDARVIPMNNQSTNTRDWRVIIGRQMSLEQATALLRRMWRDSSSSPLTNTAEVVAEPSDN